MTNNPSKTLQALPPAPPPRARQETVMGIGEDDRRSERGNLLEKAGRANVELQQRINELEQANAQLTARNATLDTALATTNAAHRAAETEVDTQRETLRIRAERITELEEMLTAVATMTGDEMARYFRDRLQAKNARIQELERGVASKFNLFSVFISEHARMLAMALEWVQVIAEELNVDLNDPDLQRRLILRIKEIHSDLDDAQIGKALSMRSPPSTRPVRDSEVEIDPLSRSKPTPTASRSPRPAEAVQAQPITMPPVGPIPSTPPGAEDGVVELDADDPHNPGRVTWDMGEPPPATR